MKHNNGSSISNIVYGGLYDLNEKNVAIRKFQLEAQNYIHTANDYGNSLEVINRAYLESKIKPKIFSKVFYNYPNFRSKRYRSIYSQINETLKRLNVVPENWILQISSFCNPNDLLNKDTEAFIREIKNDFGISQIFLEYYPIYNYSFSSLLRVKKYYEGFVDFGLMGYQNKFRGVFNKNLILNLAENDFTTCFISFLGLSRTFLSQKDFNKFGRDHYINQNIIYSLKSNLNFKNLFLITQTSSINHYHDLNEKIIKANKNIYKNIENNYGDNFRIIYKYSDPYFSKYNLRRYFWNLPHLYIKLINIVMLSFKKKKVKINLWK